MPQYGKNEMSLSEAISNLDNLLIACDDSGREAWNMARTILKKREENKIKHCPFSCFLKCIEEECGVWHDKSGSCGLLNPKNVPKYF